MNGLRRFVHFAGCVSVLSVSALLAGTCLAQGPEYRLDESGEWKVVTPSNEDPDRAVLTRTREFLAAGKFDEARATIHPWLNANSGSGSPYVPEAYILRGDAKVGQEDEFDALYDYERVVNRFPGSEMFATALEREFDVALLYLGGLRKKTFGFRIDSGRPIAEEIIMRINERLPGSKLAEKSLLALADFYYRRRDLRMAGETYDIFLSLFPTSIHRQLAIQRRIYSNVAQYKGSKYDATPLLEANVQIAQFEKEGAARADELGLGDEMTTRLNEAAADQMLNVCRWYIKRADLPSAKYTMGRLIRKFPTTRAAEQAFDEMTARGWIPAAPPVSPTEGPSPSTDTEAGPVSEVPPPAPTDATPAAPSPNKELP